MSIDKVLSAGLMGVSQGLQNREIKEDQRLAKKASRAEAADRSRMGEIKLAQMENQQVIDNARAPVELQQLQIQVESQKEEIKQTKRVQATEDSFNAFKNYMDSDGNVSSLNYFFNRYKDDPDVAAKFDNTVAVDTLNLKSQEDRQRILNLGVSQEDLDAFDGNKDGNVDWDKLTTRFIKITKKDGTRGVIDVTRFLGASGYTKWDTDAARAKKIENLNDLRSESSLAKEKAQTAKLEAQASSIPQYAEAAVNNSRGQRSSGTAKPVKKLASERQAETVARANLRKQGIDNPSASQLQSAVDDHVLDRAARQTGGTEEAKGLDATIAREAWKSKGFENMSQAALKKSSEATRLYNEVRRSRPMSPPHKKILMDMNVLTSLASESAKMDVNQAGLWDSTISRVKAYISNDATNRKEKSAYGAFVNQFRHSLFGATLTKGEAAAFKTAYGSLGQRMGPVLSGLRAAMLQIQSKLKTISNLNDDIVVQYEMGMSRPEIEAAMDGLNERMNFFSYVGSGGMSSDAAYERIEKERSEQEATRATDNQDAQDEADAGPQGPEASQEDITKFLLG